MRILRSLRYFGKDLFFLYKPNQFRDISRLSHFKMGKSALVLLAEGTEEMEFVISADVLRRAGISVTVAGLNGKDPVKCSREVVICPDAGLDEALTKGPYDVVVLPGGLGGAKLLLHTSCAVGKLLQEQEKEGRLIAAICAAPTALQTHGVCFGKSLTSYPSFREEFEKAGNYKYKEETVVVDGNLITSRGPATAFDFALTIADQLLGAGTSTPVAKAMLKV
ncbi:hypothetical protein L9F63_015892 [Diploptera punctata]|uniref:DJ-1/PfpI domain-containing protein n=1 Tax=Diploptera punctata TaxID=6984 RepID=A0AAD8A4V2_DIPPU|nr:hypothetical protein L9F63_015892 [Diploptera punctata]